MAALHSGPTSSYDRMNNGRMSHLPFRNFVHFSQQEAYDLMHRMLSGEMSTEAIAEVLHFLRRKGETIAELVGFAQAIRDMSEPLDLDQSHEPILDTCGTGGDGANTFNISTTAAFVVAGAGVAVAKHGNRAASSRCGSADVLEALGVRIDLPPEAVARCIDEAGIGFMFAQRYHPAMRFAGPVRKEIGIRTIFNILGPLTNPAGARHQVVGVPSPAVAEKVARVLGLLGTTHALVVHSGDGLDELGLGAPNRVSEVRVNGKVELTTFELRAADL